MSNRRGVTLIGLILVCLLVLYQVSTGMQCLSSGVTLLSTESLMLQSAMTMGGGGGYGSLSSSATTATTNVTDTTAADSSSSSNTNTETTDTAEASPQRSQRPVPLTELVATNEILECQRKRFQRVSDVVLDASLAYAIDDDGTDTDIDIETDTDNHNHNHDDARQQSQRKIPRIVHTTSKSRCMPSAFIDNLRPWQNLSQHSFFFHDDDAVDRLLQLDWPEFPQLRKALKCSISGAAKADLWRALVLWEYGGIYTDVDNAMKAFNATTIVASDDAFFVVENMGIPSQFFFAASPRHPLVYLLVTAIMHRLYDLPDFHNQYVPYVTGPGALKMAFQHFMKAHPRHVPPGAVRQPLPEQQRSSLNKVPAGIYTGLGNRTVTVVGTKKRPDAYIIRNAVGNKQQLFRDMGMLHFSKVRRQATNESCWRQLYETEDVALTETDSALSRPLW